jgi:hypothetical protein
MLKNVVLGILFWCLTVIAAQAQETLSSNGLIKYDPLFWKSELHLKEEQSVRLKDINTTFYLEIKNALEAKSDNQDELIASVKAILVERSQKIWQTLDAKQRKKYQRIMNESYSFDASNISAEQG